MGYEKHDPARQHQGNPRNGKSRKTLQGDFGKLELEMSRDRQATFEPKIVRKRQTRWTGFDDKILSMYARGMTTREISMTHKGPCDRPYQGAAKDNRPTINLGIHRHLSRQNSTPY